MGLSPSVQSPPAELALLRQIPTLAAITNTVVPANQSLQLYFSGLEEEEEEEEEEEARRSQFIPMEIRVSFVRPRVAATLTVLVQTANGTGGEHTRTSVEYVPPPVTQSAPYNVSCTGAAIDPRSGDVTQHTALALACHLQQTPCST
jgi:hypothetical protein